MGKIKLLSLFSGIGAFERALDEEKIDYELHGYCEFDKYASKSFSTLHSVDEILNYGDITAVDEKKLPKDLDLITYGFPCQDISVAGELKGFEDGGETTRSGLFFEALRIIKETRPKVAIAENVKNLVSKRFKEEWALVLAGLEEAGYNDYYEVLNASDYGVPQNRERVFIVSIRKDIDIGLFTFPKKVPLELSLKDLLEPEVDLKYFVSFQGLDYLTNVDLRGENFKRGDRFHPHGEGAKEAFTVNTYGGGKPNCNHVLVDVAPGVKRVMEEEAACLGTNAGSSTSSGGGVVPVGHEGLRVPENTKKGYALAQDGDGIYIDRPYQKGGVVQKRKIATIKCNGRALGVVLLEKGEYLVRRLTPKECCRLMDFKSFDDDALKAIGISDTQRYKMYGNSIVVSVARALLAQLKDCIF